MLNPASKVHAGVNSGRRQNSGRKISATFAVANACVNAFQLGERQHVCVKVSSGKKII